MRPTEERQARLALPTDHLEVSAGELEDGRGELLAVLRIAHRARGRDADATRVQGTSAAREAGEHVDRAPERLGIDPPGPIDALAETRDDHVAGELGRIAAVAQRRLHHEQPDGVRSLIDRGHATRPLLRVDRLDPFGDPGTDRVDATRQVERVVGVQALHASSRAADAAVLDRLGQVAGAVLGVGPMGGVQRLGERGIGALLLVETSDRTIGLDRATAFTASGHVSQYVVGNGDPEASRGALRITSG